MKRVQAMMGGVGMALLAVAAAAADFNVATPAEFQTALTTAQANGESDTINVATGNYNLAATLAYATSENHNLTIVGAGAATTIIDGGGVRQCLNLANDGGGGISVSGLTIRNGRAANLGGGLAVTCNNGAIALRNCEIRNNRSDRSAGGAYLGGRNGAITVDDCVVDGNTLDPVTGDDGGGLDIYIDTGGSGSINLLNSTVTNNSIGECPSAVGSPDGAGVFMYHRGAGGVITVRNNLIADNTALGGPAGFYLRAPVSTTLIFDHNIVRGNESGRPGVGVSGGGVHLHLETATMTFTNNIVVGNQAIGPYANGGGMDLSVNAGGTCDIHNNVFADNTAQQHGGGIQLLLAVNISRAVLAGNLFVNNQAGPGASEGSGGGLMLNAECQVNLVNNTFRGNTADDAGGLGYYCEGTAGRNLHIANDIYRANTTSSIVNMGPGTITATYSNIAGGAGQPWFGTGCIDADPLFFDAANPTGADSQYTTTDDGLHLTAASPSANTGSNAAVPGALALDLAGQARTQGAAVDMGCYEGVASEPVPRRVIMVADPVASGDTLPAPGEHSLTSPQAIQALPAAGYYFDQWMAEPSETVFAAPTSAATTVGFAADCTITAHFLEIPPTATLSVAVSPAEGGVTAPTAGEHPDQPTATPIQIIATPAEGYGFVNWTATRHLTIGDPLAMTTTVSMVADGTVTANFARIPHLFRVTLGSRFTMEAEHVGEDRHGNPFGDEAFSRKPKVFGTYYDPVKDPGRTRLATAAAKVVFDRAANARAVGIWTKKICLLNKRAILPEQTADTYLPLAQAAALTMENLWIAVANSAGNAGPFAGGELTLVPPAITGVFPDNTFTPGSEITTVHAGDIIFIEGNWFGIRAPKVWLEYPDAANTIKARTCKSVKPYLFADAAGIPGRSCMDLNEDARGHSRLAVQLPPFWPSGWNHGIPHNLVIDNGIGRAYFQLSTATE